MLDGPTGNCTLGRHATRPTAMGCEQGGMPARTYKRTHTYAPMPLCAHVCL